MRQHAAESVRAAAPDGWRHHKPPPQASASGSTLPKRGSRCRRPAGRRPWAGPVGAARMARSKMDQRCSMVSEAAGQRLRTISKDARQDLWPMAHGRQMAMSDEDAGQQRWHMQHLLRRCFVRSLIDRLAQEAPRSCMNHSARPRSLSRYVSEILSLDRMPRQRASGRSLCPQTSSAPDHMPSCARKLRFVVGRDQLRGTLA